MYGRIATSSITYAMQAKERLYDEGILCDIIRLRADETPAGCAFGLEIPSRQMARAAEILTRAGIRFRQIPGKL